MAILSGVAVMGMGLAMALGLARLVLAGLLSLAFSGLAARPTPPA